MRERVGPNLGRSSRRRVMLQTLSAGFALAVRPVAATAITTPALKAGVAWYGRLVGEKDAMKPRFPIDVVSELKAPVLGLYGGKDQGIPLESVEQMRKALTSSSSPFAKKSQIQVYPEAGHAFLADYRPSFHQESAADAWKRSLAFFKKQGVS